MPIPKEIEVFKRSAWKPVVVEGDGSTLDSKFAANRCAFFFGSIPMTIYRLCSAMSAADISRSVKITKISSVSAGLVAENDRA